MTSHPITIIGAGIMGLSLGWEMARRGMAVRVIEARRIGAGSSGGTVGALAPHAPETWNPKKDAQLDSLLMAAAFWDGVAQAGGVDPGYARTGRIQPVDDAGDLPRLRDRVAGAERNWRGAARMWLTDAPPDEFVWPNSASGWFVMDDLTARLSPRQAGAALAAAITARGGEIVTGQRAVPGEIGGPVIWASGAEGLDLLGNDLGRKIGQGVKGQSALLRFAAPDAPQIFADGLHIVFHGDGTTAVGSTSENEFHDGAGVDAQLDDLIGLAGAVCPALAGAEVIDRWAGVRPRARSRAPLMGAWPGRPGNFVMNGGFKIGFGMAPLMARMMADLVLGGRDTIPEMFRLQGAGDTPISAG